MSIGKGPPSPAAHALTDWELWACAQQQISQHGEAAKIAAAMRADELLEAGDAAGHRVWLDILARIIQLTTAEPGDIRH